MAFSIPKMTYTGAIKEVTLGTGASAVTVGGETCYPFYTFEGTMPHPPKIAFEVWDAAPEDWPDWAVEPYRDVIADPVAWAKKAITDYKAEMIALLLKSADPNGMNRAVDDVVKTVKAVSDAVAVPLIVWGCANDEKDALMLRQVAEQCDGKNLALGPVTDKNYKQIGAVAIGYNHVVIASTPIDVNLAKQLNILLGNLGVPENRILIDPTTGGLGYGLEYSYSVMERDRMAALTQEDVKLQTPIICNLGNEVWKTKEAKTKREDNPKLGDPKTRAVLMESVAAMTLGMAGADILIMRHPEAISATRRMFQELV
ncbi:MAG: acetyl-CoA decarbonylase/synthase complex subunit delta [Syntrophorhabdales bacterium]|jgi:acetyl-CoA decarbonylase/synthase complex subunit delta